MSKKHGAKDDVVSPGGKSPGTTKFSRRQVLRNAGKIAYTAPLMTVFTLLPPRTATAASPPPFPGSTNPYIESKNRRDKSRTTSRKKERRG